MTSGVIVIIIFQIEWWPLVTDGNISIIVIVTVRLEHYKSSVFLVCLYADYQPIPSFNDSMALLNINNSNPLLHNNDLCHHQIIILLIVVNDAAPCFTCHKIRKVSVRNVKFFQLSNPNKVEFQNLTKLGNAHEIIDYNFPTIGYSLSYYL